jgi:serine/threonine protein kinase/ABC-type phosphate/phosphonate transport system substrate-binding protein
MTTTKKCIECGGELRVDALMNLCHSCLLDFAAQPVQPEPPLPASDFSNWGRSFASYALGRQIGRGGMGVVYEAMQTNLRRPVALKMILEAEAFSPRTRQRFTLEAETAASLDHTNIVPIYEIGEHQGQLFLCMKLIVGGALRQKIASGDLCLTPKGSHPNQIDLRERAAAIVRVMATIARAVEHAHSHHVLHRDLKPANILLDEQGEPHLTDFGLAKVLGAAAEIMPSGITDSGMTLGTPSYMSPEQAAGQRLTPASDVYSLGIILYEMLTGCLPFKAGTLLELLRLISEQEPKAPSSYNSRIDKDLDTICLKCLEKNPAARYPTAQALADDLEHWLGGEPISARRVSCLSRTVRWVRRNPVGTSLILSLGICLAASLGFLNLQRLRAREASIRIGSVGQEIGDNIELTWTNKAEDKVTVNSYQLATLINGPIPMRSPFKLTYALRIPDDPVSTATRYARFLGELGKEMSRRLGYPVNFDLHLYKARSWEAATGARQGADIQNVTFLTYVRMLETSPNMQPVVMERHRSQAAIFASTTSGISNLTQIPGHSMAFAHTNSVISFLGKVELARANIHAQDLSVYTNLVPAPFKDQRAEIPKLEIETQDTRKGDFAHEEVVNAVIRNEFELGLAPVTRIFEKQRSRAALVELHRFTITPDLYVTRAGLPTDVVSALRNSLLAMKDKKLLGTTKASMQDGFEAVTDAEFARFRKLITNEWRFFEKGKRGAKLDSTNAASLSVR